MSIYDGAGTKSHSFICDYCKEKCWDDDYKLYDDGKNEYYFCSNGCHSLWFSSNEKDYLTKGENSEN